MVVSREQGIEELTRFATEVIRQSGELALGYYGRGKPYIKFDEGLVTEAEIRVTDFFEKQIYEHFPEHQVFKNNQQNRGYTHKGNGALWVYDPFDGVANFQAGIPVWGMSLALLENFWPILGVFYMPVTGDLFFAEAGKHAFRGKQPIHVYAQGNIDNESLLLTYSRFHQHCRATFPGKMRDLGCTAAHMCYVAMGRADAAVIANESYQDLAATSIIVEAAGGKIYKMDGKAFFLNDYLEGQQIDERLIVVAPENYALVRRCIHPHN